MFKCETPYKLIYLDTIDSTNNYAKRLLADSCEYNDGTVNPQNIELPLVVAADSQTSGRGRLGRNFASPAGTGIYMSIVIPFSECTVPLSLVTPAAAVATCSAIRKVCNALPQIKWVNDLYLNNKKICGILTEMHNTIVTENSCSADKNIASLIIGIGVNCFPGSFPNDIADIAGYITDDLSEFDKGELLTEIATNILGILRSADTGTTAPTNSEATMPEPQFMSEYRELCFILGKTIAVSSLTSDEKYNATAVDIDHDGALIVERLNNLNEPELVRLVSADVSINFD